MRTGMIVILGALLALACMAQAAETPVVINTGEATVFALPGTVTFTLVKNFTAADCKTATEQCGAFLAQAQQNFRTGEVQPQEMQVVPPSVDNVNTKTVRGGLKLVYSMSTFNAPSTGPVAFGGLCDKVLAMAASLGAAMEGPVLASGDPEAVSANAVAQATAAAYTHAETVAFALKSAVYAVQAAEVLEVVWGQGKEAPGEVPQLSCTAKVKITYQLAPQQTAG